jgi:hypothetical protein
MKLSNQQIEALIAKIQKENKAKILQEVEALRNDPVIIKKAEGYKQLLSKVPKDIRDCSRYSDDRDMLKKIITELVDKSKIKTKELYSSDLRNDILVASIESNDLKELSNKLGISL